MRQLAFPMLALVSAGLIYLGTARLAAAADATENTPRQTRVDHTNTNTAAPAELCVEPAESFNGKTIAQWRAAGPEGLAELIEQMRPTIDAYREAKTPKDLPVKSPDVSNKALADLLLLDHVAQQRDAYSAGLYWYTDLGAAKQQAQRTGRPILSLRMLGELVDEYSCANSRFFRTTLYADESVGKLMREQFVLHWQSVRPVPVITVDMGDGRTIKRTITGNSAHYVLDPNGRVVDCLPGLYGPDTFERFITQSGELAKRVKDADETAFVHAVRDLHAYQGAELDRAWARYMGVIHAQDEADKPEQDTRQIALRTHENNDNRPKMPNAMEAGRIAFAGKMVVERPLVRAVMPNAPTASEAADDMALWRRVAEAYKEEARLDEGSRQLMAIKAPRESMQDALNRAISKRRVESPLARMVRNFEQGVAIETARNEHLLRRQLHDWFAKAEAPLELDALNKRVYADLFLTPDEDPWLGLVPADTYSALDGGGLLGVNHQSAGR
ncbi:MAG: hypothetical protein ACE37H_10530 [Phycisphaeraceae bacterium]